MNIFKEANTILATVLDWNAKCVKRTKGDGDKIRRYARRKLKQQLQQSMVEEDDYV